REVGREDDVDDVPVVGRPVRRDRLGDRDRALEEQLVGQAELLAELARERFGERLATLDAPAGEQPVLLARLLLTAQQDASVPAQERRDAEARPHQRWDEPKPRTPRSEAGSSSTSTSSTSGTGTMTSWAIRIPGSTVKGSCASVLRSATRSSPR